MTDHARPLIGITVMHSGASADGRKLQAVRPTYLRAIEAAGGIPLIISLTDDLSAVRVLYDLCAGILLPGGGDVDPAYYGEVPHPQLGPVDPQRDAVEIALARWAAADGKPLLGICRGLQVINVALGGSLYQDIPAQFETTIDHRANTRTRAWTDLTHPLTITTSSRLATVLSVEQIGCNTMHHQAIKTLAPGLRPVAYAPDGIIEAVETTGDHYLLAVQCHPEHLWDSSEPRWQALFADFIAACRP
ncbi:gamma-glutamyl-gamma-aminobutyrate hydrolase family protein [uncultured Chloroflexus sp.]|uniref:gamma-glutamyl-gamma-aminobutyrate hydrolase family protein n=1 Tax=uncultured Chloroflexus sp. TaxID=214040 RepID=UPI002634A28E|nr:gamma-glutamyl-gamma-aminobutyrate hydrolase family protein [uncultured Chloroflexus sp.]